MHDVGRSHGLAPVLAARGHGLVVRCVQERALAAWRRPLRGRRKLRLDHRQYPQRALRELQLAERLEAVSRD
eukprot:251332-Pyramimonas_sp.AAC.1